MGRYFHVLLHIFVASKFFSTFKDWAFILSKSWENFLSNGINAQTVRICLRLVLFLGNFYCTTSFNRFALNGIPELPATLCYFFITRKVKIGNIWNLVFLSVQPIPDLSCKLDHFWKNKYFFYFNVVCLLGKPEAWLFSMPLIPTSSIIYFKKK